ncbi:uncharacterized protein LOC116181776 isoform X2 [Photinus pyralis]|uniref:uncharacterized protein LOC116181776 isoform X2 n=1 Tax=Photinus pyralis TaxID=7054 RepID=UPI00126775B1|nr:uncharacterized protein LOC116181776 isoform X2 [Photinus pyralis]
MNFLQFLYVCYLFLQRYTLFHFGNDQTITNPQTYAITFEAPHNTPNTDLKLRHPFEDITLYNVYTTIYMRCPICLHIAKEINHVIEVNLDEATDPLEEIKIISDLLKEFCPTHFDRKAVLKCGGLFTLLKYGSHGLDEKWNTMLKGICYRYVNHINVHNLYHKVIEKQFPMGHMLCRSGGVFRDCANVDIDIDGC